MRSCASTLVAVFIILIGGPVQAEDASPTINVVKTYKELLAQPLVRVGDVDVRVGIESNECRTNEGLLVYAWTKGKVAPPRNHITHSVGPLWIQVGSVKVKERADVQLFQERDENLFVNAIFAQGPGDTTVTLHGPDDAVVGQFTLKLLPEKAQPWVPVQLSRSGTMPIGEIVIRNSVGIAWPAETGTQPYPIPENLDRSLPPSVPAEPDKDFRLSMEGMNLKLESQHEFSNADTYLLARWWLNGAPYMSEPSRPVLMQGGGMHSTAKSVIFHLDLNSETLKSKSGDKIELQLLYCGSGWKHVDIMLQQMMQMLAREAELQSPDVRLTNRVEFVVP